MHALQYRYCNIRPTAGARLHCRCCNIRPVKVKVCLGEQCVSAYVVNTMNGITTFKCTVMSGTESVFNL